ncbi:hypothetical protein Sjap_004012 [Stephania japonica]|uniref:Sugar phosphate transporter domain-containing protein n=1 Tax=Stephania japonica TaxID=461633 RepID=A0AAP0K294_9MAGN
MLTLNSAVTFSKYPNRTSSTSSSRTPLHFSFHSFNPFHSYPFRFSSTPISQILSTIPKSTNFRLFSPIHELPFGFSPKRSKPTSPIPKAASEPPQQAHSDDQTQSSKPQSLKLAMVFGLWYFHNIVFNIYNKKVLNFFPFPWLLASFQLFIGSLWMLFLWSFKLQHCPKITKPFVVALLGPALFHTIGHISACVSFSKVAVSFTHVIKSSEPVFSVVFSSLLGDTYPLQVWLSVLPIVLGCSLAAITEVSFNVQGLWGALISNVGFVLRNIYSKRSLQSFKEVNGLNLYGWISILSLLYLFPVAVFVEGSQWVGGYYKAIEAALDNISPLTFSVGNTMKRVVVIVSTVLVFRNPVRPLNALGSGIAIIGTFLYSQVASSKGGDKDGGEKKS